MANGDTNLEALVGEWSMEATFPFDPPIAGRGRVSFERLLGGFPYGQASTPVGLPAGGSDAAP
jgi:hypothetical protein